MHADERKPYLDEPRSPQVMRSLVKSILDEWGCTGYFVSMGNHIVSLDKTDGTATIYPEKHVVSLSPGMLYWSTPAVVAMTLHEVGHIVLGQYLGEHKDCIKNWVDEYEADEFAFDALKTHYGYVPTSAGLWLLKALGTWRWDWDSHTHPSHEHRWERLMWNGFVSDDPDDEAKALGLEEAEEYI